MTGVMNKISSFFSRVYSAILSDKSKKVFGIVLKVLACTLFTLYVARLFLNDDFVWVIKHSYYGESWHDRVDVPQTFVRWLHITAICLIPTAAFFKSKLLTRLTVVLTLTAFVLDIVYFKETLNYFTTNSFRAIYVEAPWRKVEYIAELVLMATFLFIYTVMNCKNLIFRSGKEVGKFFIYLPFVMLLTIPVYLPQSLFGFTTTKMNYFSGPHIAWILLIFITFFVLTALFRHDTKEHKEIVLCFLTLFLFQHYNSIYLMDLNASRLPFQLCNLGAYFLLILFIFRKAKCMQKFFDFSFIANVPGAFIAIIAVDVREGILSYWNIHYYLEHTWVFILPLLFFTLGIYSFPKENALKHFAIGFAAYFFACALLGILFNCVLYKENHWFFNRVNYFYLFSDLVLSFFSFMSFAFQPNLSIVWGGYSFHPIYMIAIGIGFMVICFVVHLMNDKFFRVAKEHIELHRINKQLKEEKNNA